MSDHLELCADHLITPATLESMRAAEVAGPLGEGSSRDDGWSMDEFEFSDDEDGGAFGQKMECRICQEEDLIMKMEAPCGCSGSLKFAHRKCVQRWCNEKKGITCEICHQPYRPDYTAPSPTSPSHDPHSEDTAVDISEGWTVHGTPRDVHSPRLLAAAAAERLLETEYDECAAANASGGALCRSAVLILMALLLMRHALSLAESEEEDDFCTIVSVFLVRVMSFLVPCYVMVWAINLLHSRSQRHEAAGEPATTEVALMLQSGQRREGLRFTVASESEEAPHES